MPIAAPEASALTLAQSSVLRSGLLLPGGLCLEAPLGIGGTAEVWRARTPDGTAVAVKMLRSDLRDAAAAESALRTEYACLSQVRHANILRVETVLPIAGRLALVMEYCEGGDLVSLLGAHPRHWIGSARALAAALRALHAAGWVHRDLKPRNVLFAAGQRVVLGDFAAAAPIGARAPFAGAAAPYRAPWAGSCADPADDAYAFAVLLHELVTGQWPAAGSPRLDAYVVGAPWLQPLAAVIEYTLAGVGSVSGSLSACGDVLESLMDEIDEG